MAAALLLLSPALGVATLLRDFQLVLQRCNPHASTATYG
jgi:hypothetical protein